MIIITIILGILILPVIIYLFVLLYAKRENNDNQNLTTKRPSELSVILPCYNESHNIERKINELLKECNYLENYEIIIIDDGSTDSTRMEIENNVNIEQLKKYYFNERKGKANAINFGVSKARFDILLLTDARQSMSEGAIYHLISHFQVPSIGAVSAKLINGQRKSLIRSSINCLKKHESDLGSTVGVYGALYAMRKKCYTKIPDETILDDLLIPLHVLHQGQKVKFEENAIVFDLEIGNFYSINRSIRLVQGLLQVIRSHSSLILSLPPRAVLFLFCQKYFKLFIPILIIMLIVIFFYSINLKLLTIIIISFFTMIFFLGIREASLLVRLSAILLLKIFKLQKTNTKWEKLEKNPSTKGHYKT